MHRNLGYGDLVSPVRFLRAEIHKLFLYRSDHCLELIPIVRERQCMCAVNFSTLIPSDAFWAAFGYFANDLDAFRYSECFGCFERAL